MDEHRLSDVLVDFALTLAADLSIQRTLDHLVGRVVDVLPVTGAGILMMDDDRPHHFVAATDCVIVRIETLQVELDEGPCLVAHRSGRRVVVEDLRADGRFPRFSPEAVRAGLGSVFSLPLLVGGQALGALELYGAQPTRLSDEALDIAQVLADVIAAYVHNAKVRTRTSEAVASLQRLALHDPLTQLPNRLLLEDRCEQALRRCQRDPATFMAVLFLDVDRLKAVNDRFGHDVGDELLRRLAGRLRGAVRPGDTLARLAGDEFVIVCASLTRESEAEAVAARIQAALEEPIDIDGTAHRPSISIGIAYAGNGRGSPQDALKRADAAMYAAKRTAPPDQQ